MRRGASDALGTTRSEPAAAACREPRSWRSGVSAPGPRRPPARRVRPPPVRGPPAEAQPDDERPDRLAVLLGRAPRPRWSPGPRRRRARRRRRRAIRAAASADDDRPVTDAEQRPLHLARIGDDAAVEPLARARAPRRCAAATSPPVSDSASREGPRRSAGAAARPRSPSSSSSSAEDHVAEQRPHARLLGVEGGLPPRRVGGLHRDANLDPLHAAREEGDRRRRPAVRGLARGRSTRPASISARSGFRQCPRYAACGSRSTAAAPAARARSGSTARATSRASRRARRARRRRPCRRPGR